MKKLLAALLLLLCTAVSTYAQVASPWPEVIAPGSPYDFGNGPVKLRVISGTANVFSSQGSGTGSTSGSSTTLTLTGTPTTPPCVGCKILATGITAGTTVAAYNGTTTVTLSAAMTVAGGTAVSWGAACPATLPTSYIQASAGVDYYNLYTLARICALSPGAPSEIALLLPYETAIGANTVLGNFTSASAAAVANAMPSCPDLGGNHLNYVSGTGITCGVNGGTAVSVIVGMTSIGSGTDTRVLFDNAGILGEYAISGSGNVCMTVSCVMTTPNLGTPSAGTLTNTTGFPIANLAGAGTGVLTWLATPSSANLAAAVTGETGSGALVFGTSPTLVTPVLGVASATSINGQTIDATITRTIASGAKALATGAVGSGTCTSAQTDTATGTLTTDTVIPTFSADPTSTTGYNAVTTGRLSIAVYPTADTVNFKVCNNTLASITPGAVTVNWRVVR